MASEKKFDKYYKFATLRNPWDRVVSQFFYRKKPHPRATWMSDTTHMTFREFVLSWHRKGGNPQWKYVTDSKGRVLLDDFIRFEYLEKDFKRICDKLDMPFIKERFEQRNISSRTNYKQASVEKKAGLATIRTLHEKRPYWKYYDDETRQAVGKLFKKEIDVFGFKFLDLK